MSIEHNQFTSRWSKPGECRLSYLTWCVTVHLFFGFLRLVLRFCSRYSCRWHLACQCPAPPSQSCGHLQSVLVSLRETSAPVVFEPVRLNPAKSWHASCHRRNREQDQTSKRQFELDQHRARSSGPNPNRRNWFDPRRTVRTPFLNPSQTTRQAGCEASLLLVPYRNQLGEFSARGQR